jgi:hypothetical protein
MEENTGKDKPKPRRTGQLTTMGKDKRLIRVFLGRDANGNLIVAAFLLGNIRKIPAFSFV